MVGQHERLKIWQKSYDLARDLIQASERFPRPQQQEGLGSEIRRTSLDLIQSVMLANSTQNISVNQDLDQEIAEQHPFLRVAFDPVEVTE